MALRDVIPRILPKTALAGQPLKRINATHALAANSRDEEQVCAPDYLHNNKPEGCRDGMEPPVQPGPDGSYPVPVPVPADPAPSPTPLQATTAFGGWWAAILICSP